jgi:hypothetical protein
MGYTMVRIVVVVVMLILVGAVALTVPASTTSTSGFNSNPTPSAPNTVNVSGVVVNVPTDACGLQGITPGAFSVPAGTAYPFGWWLPWNGGSVPCTVSNVTSDTPGFSVGTDDFPLTVTSNQTPLLFEVFCPSSYDGVLTLTVL